jgi:hypothetical protein
VVTALKIPRDLAVENHFVNRKVRDGFGQRGETLWQSVARIQLNLTAALVGKQTNAVELPLEEPIAAAESLLRQRGRHRLEPVGHSCGHGKLLNTTVL